MAEVLVPVDHVGVRSARRPPSCSPSLVASASRRPSSSAMGMTPPRASRGLRGAEGLPGGRRRGDRLSRCPQAEILAQIAGAASPAAILVASSAEGQGGRRPAGDRCPPAWSPTPSVSTSPTARSRRPSRFAGSYTVKASVNRGTLIIAVKPNSAAPEESPSSPSEESVAYTPSGASAAAAIVSTVPKGGIRAPGADRGRDRRLGRPRHRRRLLQGRGLRGQPRRGCRRVPRRCRRRVVPAHLPGGPDRQTGQPVPVCRLRHLGRHPAPGRDADQQDDHRGQQGPRGPDLRARRLRRRRRPLRRPCRTRPPRWPPPRAEPHRV